MLPDKSAVSGQPLPSDLHLEKKERAIQVPLFYQLLNLCEGC